MKRISKPSDRPISISRMISVSEKFFIATALTLIDLKPISAETLIPSNTSLRQSLRFTSRNFSGSRASRLIFNRLSPASFNALACSLRKKALVVMATSSIPSICVNMLTSVGRSLRIRGSPPVRRNLLIPIPAPIRAIRVISSNVSNLSRDINSTLSAGMQ